jgi:hypothetical protein
VFVVSKDLLARPPSASVPGTRPPRAGAEAGLEVVALLRVTHLPKPVDDLAETVLERDRPCAGALLPLPSEQTLGAGLLELDKVVRVLYRIADDQIAAEVAEQVVLEGQPVEPVDVGVIGAEESCQVPTLPEERHDLFALGQGAVLGEQDPEVLDFLPATARFPDVRDERLQAWGRVYFV